MKRISIGALIVSVVAAGFFLLAYSQVVEKAHANQGVCSLHTIGGTYAIHSQGQLLNPPLPFGEAGIATLDGEGNLAGTTTVNIGGSSFTVPFTGSYTVNPDCTTNFIVASASGETLHISGVIVGPSGKEIVQVSTDPGSVFTSVLKRF